MQVLDVFVAGQHTMQPVALRGGHDCTHAPDTPALKRALEASQAGAALQAGSVLSIARLPNKGPAAVHMHIVVGDELTDAVQAAAKRTASHA